MSDALFKAFSPLEIQTLSNPEVTIRGHQGGTGPPLLLIHGFPQTHSIWHKVAPALSQSYTLVMPDLRGYGDSSSPASADPNDHTLYAKSEMAADMSKVMTHLGHSSYFVVGHDRGGRVAHKMCIDYPHQVKKAIFLDIAPTEAMYSAMDQLAATAYWHWNFLVQPSPFPEDAMTGLWDVFSRKMLRGLPAGSKGEAGIFAKEAFADYERCFLHWATVHGMCEDYRAAATIDLEEQRDNIAKGRKIKVPLRVLWGKAGLVEKKFDGREVWQRLCEDGLVDGRSRALDSGHYIPEEVPDELVADILEFMK